MKKVIGLCAALVALLALTAAPAGADVHAEASPLCADPAFDSVAALTSAGASARSADTAREPSLDVTYESLPASAQGKAGKGFRTTVPLWFHVITDGAAGDVTQAQIDEQLTVLNLAFAGFYGGAPSGFKFKLAGVTRTNNAEWFHARAGSLEERRMKKALRRGGWDTLNVYSSTADVYLGWAYLPGLPAAQQYLDGIVFDWESMPGTSTRYAARYDLGMTLVHEAGHWLNLEHTFYGGCTPKGDYVDDTPAMLVPTSGCPVGEGKDTCPKLPGLDPIHNYMDYSYDACYNQFTPGQVARARDSWLYFRAA